MPGVGNHFDPYIGHGVVAVAGLSSSEYLIRDTKYDKCRQAQGSKTIVQRFLRDEAFSLDL